MRLNKDSLKARVNNISSSLNISQNIIYDRFFFDAFLTRISKSKYANSFVLKGGLYLSSFLGVETRSTMDIDFSLRKERMIKDRVSYIIQEICEINMEDNVTFRVLDIKDIRGEDKYGGYQFKILGKLDNVRYEFGVDIATGDPIFPCPIQYPYKCILTNEIISIKAYSIESVVAEKLETVLEKQLANSRSKDYYDLYALRKLNGNDIKSEFFKKAFSETCTYRKFDFSKEKALLLIDEIRKSETIEKRWLAYTKRAAYARGLSLQDVTSSIEEWINIL